jgi:hypothetical protein
MQTLYRRISSVMIVVHHFIQLQILQKWQSELNARGSPSPASGSSSIIDDLSFDDPLILKSGIPLPSSLAAFPLFPLAVSLLDPISLALNITNTILAFAANTLGELYKF